MSHQNSDLFVLVGDVSREINTFRGKVLVHKDKDEMEFLIFGARAVPCPSYVERDDMMLLQDHPSFASTVFPIDARTIKQFKDAQKRGSLT